MFSRDDLESFVRQIEAQNNFIEQTLMITRQSSIHGDVEGIDACVDIVSGILAPITPVVDRFHAADPALGQHSSWKIHGTGKGRILLLGHLDTVSGGPTPRIDGDTLYGIGTYDMKAGVILACGVMQALALVPDQFETVELLLFCDEEFRSLPLDCPQQGEDWSAVLCFEGGEAKHGIAQLITSRRGAWTLEITATGESGHTGATPGKAGSALRVLAELSGKLEHHNDHSSAVAVQLHSGQYPNIIPDGGRLQFDVRTIDAKYVKAIIADIPQEYHGVSLEVDTHCRFPPLPASKASDQFVASLHGLVRDKPGVMMRGGSSDANFFAHPERIVIDGLGPYCDGPDPSHSPREHVLISSYDEQFRLALACALEALVPG